MTGLPERIEPFRKESFHAFLEIEAGAICQDGEPPNAFADLGGQLILVVARPALRTSSQSEAFRIALQMLGDLTGFGLGYFDFDDLLEPGLISHL